MENLNAVQELIDFVKEISPLIWESAKRQVLVNGVMAVIWLLISSTLMYVFFRIFNFCREGGGRSDWDAEWILGTVLFGFGIFGFFVVFAINLDIAVRAFLSPDFEALKLLLSLVKPE